MPRSAEAGAPGAREVPALGAHDFGRAAKPLQTGAMLGIAASYAWNTDTPRELHDDVTAAAARAADATRFRPNPCSARARKP